MDQRPPRGDDYPQCHHQQPAPADIPRGRSPVSRWQLSFNGTSASLSIEDLIYRLDKMQRTEHVTAAYMARNIHRILKGKADLWYWGFDRDYPNATWAVIREALLMQFRSYTDDAELLVEMTNRKQGNRESFDDYLTAMSILNNRRQVHLTDQELIKIIRNNLTSKLANMIYMTPFRSITAFRDGCMDAERFIHSRSSNQSDSRNVHELITGITSNTTDVIEAYQHAKPVHSKQRIDQTKWTCWNCDQLGHGYRECPVLPTGYFCYKCGLKGVISTYCTRCHPENGSMLVVTTGDRRQPTSSPVINSKPQSPALLPPPSK